MVPRRMSLRLLVSTGVVWLSLQGIAHGDLDPASAFKTYQVSFADWVVVYLTTQVSASAEDYFVGVGSKVVNKKVRFVVEGFYVDSESGRRWYQKIGSKIEEAITRQCKVWAQEGYPISLNDFEIIIRKQ